MTVWREETFRPVLSIMCRKDYREAVDLIHARDRANGEAVFVRDGDAARTFAMTSRSALSASKSRWRSSALVAGGNRSSMTTTCTALRVSGPSRG